MEEKGLLEDTESMMRLSVKSKLIKDVSSVYESLSKYKLCWPKSAFRLANKTITRDFKKGLRVLNRKIPVFIELPELEKEGNGAYSEKRYDDPPEKTKEIKVSSLPARRERLNVETTDAEIIES